MKFLNRLLYQVHRWVGVVLGLFMFFWFFTGLVIMYSTPTTQTRSQQLAHAETLAPEVGWLSLGEAWDRSAEQRKAAEPKPKAVDAAARAETQGGKGKDGDVAVSIADARLIRSAGEPVWLVEDSQGQRFALSALDGSLRKTSPDQALKIAENWFNADGNTIIKASYLETVEKPIILRNQDALSPFHRIAVGDGGEMLISSRTGEVLHASNTSGPGFLLGRQLAAFVKAAGIHRLGQNSQRCATVAGLIRDDSDIDRPDYRLVALATRIRRQAHLFRGPYPTLSRILV